MKVTLLKEIVKDCNTNVIRTEIPKGQDPFVLFPKKYKLKMLHFRTYEEIQAYFKDKNVIAMDCEALLSIKTDSILRVYVSISNPKEDFDKLVEMKQRAKQNEQPTN